MGFCSCRRMFPHGRISIYAFMMGIATYLFAVGSFFGCYFIEANASLSSDYPEIILTTSTGNDIHAGFGLYSYEDAASLNNNGSDSDYWACYAYEPEQLNQFDGIFKTARILGLIANVLIGISVVLLLTLTCIQYNRIALNIMAGMLMIGGVLQILTFIFFASDFCNQFQCEFYAGSGMALSASFCSFLTCFMVMGMPDDATTDPYKENSSHSLQEPLDGGKQQQRHHHHQQRGQQEQRREQSSSSGTGSRLGHQSARKGMAGALSDAGSSGVYKMSSSEEGSLHRGRSFSDEEEDRSTSRRSSEPEKLDLV